MNIYGNKAFLIGLSLFQNQMPLFITTKLKKKDFSKIKTTFHGLLNNTQQFRCHFLFIKLVTYLTMFLYKNSSVYMSVRIILGFLKQTAP